MRKLPSVFSNQLHATLLLMPLVSIPNLADATVIPITVLMIARDLPPVPTVTLAPTMSRSPAQLLQQNMNCLLVGEALALCGSPSPDFTTHLPTAQAKCLCYSNTLWSPNLFDSAIASCASFASTAVPAALDPLQKLEGFCNQVGDVQALGTNIGNSLTTSISNGISDNVLHSAGFALSSTPNPAVLATTHAPGATLSNSVVGTVATTIGTATAIISMVNSMAVSATRVLTALEVPGLATSHAQISTAAMIGSENSATTSMAAGSTIFSGSNISDSSPISVTSTSLFQGVDATGPSSGTVMSSSTESIIRSYDGSASPELPITHTSHNSALTNQITSVPKSHSSSRSGTPEMSTDSFNLGMPTSTPLLNSNGEGLLERGDSSVGQVVSVTCAMAVLVGFL